MHCFSIQFFSANIYNYNLILCIGLSTLNNFLIDLLVFYYGISFISPKLKNILDLNELS